MAANALIWAYALGLCWLYGFLFLRLAARMGKLGPEARPVVTLVGMAVVTSLAAILSLWMPVGLVVNLVLAGAGAGLAAWHWKELRAALASAFAALRRANKLVLLAWAAVALIVLVKSAGEAANYDTGLYHAQAIRWIESYPAVPGLGNLHDRLAFNSNGLLLAALFSFAFTGIQSFHATNAFLFVLVAAFAFSKLNGLFQGEIRLSAGAAALFPLLMRRIFSLELSSPGTDLPSALLVWVIVILSAEKIETRAEDSPDARFWSLLVLSLFAVTVKLSCLPVLLLPLYFIARQLGAGLPPAKKLAALAPVAAAGAFLLLPWLARGTITSGYLVYPAAQVDLFNPDWKIPRQKALDSAEWIRSYARIASPDREAVLGMPLAEWAPVWYSRLEPLDRQILWAAAAGALILAMGLALKPWRAEAFPGGFAPYLPLYITAEAGIAYWFIQAPSMRFGYTFLGIFILLALAPLFAGLLRGAPRIRHTAILLLLLAILGYQAAGFANPTVVDQVRSRWLLPADYPISEDRVQSIGGLQIFTPRERDQCWYEPFPCTPAIEDRLQPRGAGYRDGFREQP